MTRVLSGGMVLQVMKDWKEAVEAMISDGNAPNLGGFDPFRNALCAAVREERPDALSAVHRAFENLHVRMLGARTTRSGADLNGAVAAQELFTELEKALG